MLMIKKYILLTSGIVSLSIGIVGIILPVLPTTPFLLLSAYLFYKSSEKMHSWLMETRILGEYIYNYQEYKAVKRRIKITSIIILWITLIISMILVDKTIITILLGIIGTAVTVHLLSLRSLEDIDDYKHRPDAKGK